MDREVVQLVCRSSYFVRHCGRGQSGRKGLVGEEEWTERQGIEVFYISGKMLIQIDAYVCIMTTMTTTKGAMVLGEQVVKKSKRLLPCGP